MAACSSCEPFLLLLLLLLPVTSSLPTSCTRPTSIRVSANGMDSQDCTEGVRPNETCATLNYALKPSSLKPCTIVTVSSNLNLSEPIEINSNITDLTIEGDKTGGPQWTINCAFGAGIYFDGVSRVLVSDLAWVNCSVGFNDSSENITLRTALYFINGGDVAIAGCTFTSQHGSGVCMDNVVEKVNVTNSNFIDNALLHPCSNESTSCYNQSIGLQVLGSNISNSVYTIQGCRFEKNDNSLSAIFTRDQDILNYHKHRTVSHGGGLEVRLMDDCSYNEINIRESNFSENKALWGAGIEIGLGERSAFNNVSITRCNFVENQALTGGGMRLTIFPEINYDGFGSLERSNVYTVSECNITGNKAQSAGGVSYMANRQLSQANMSHINIIRCHFANNTANDSGAAIGLTAWNNEVGGYPTYANISDSTFFNNAIFYDVDVTETYGIGVVITDNIMLGIANSTFTHNFGCALVVSATTVVLAGSVTFDDNFGINGGAMHLLGSSWITLTKGLQLTFSNNEGFLSGGAVFASFTVPQPTLDTRFCIIEYEDRALNQSQWDAVVTFTDNTAKVSGQSIFLSTPAGCYRGDNNTLPFTNSEIFRYTDSNATSQTSTPPQKIKFGDPSVNVNRSYFAQVMLGQPFDIRPLALNVFNQSTLGSAVLEIYCGAPDAGCIDDKSSYELVGQDLVELNNKHRETPFYLIGPEKSDEEPYLLFFSDSFPSAIGFLHLNITQCHVGYTYSVTERKCICLLSDDIYCSSGTACIKYGYWAGLVNGRMTYSNCPAGNCGYVNGHCSTGSCDESFRSFCRLPETDSDELCTENRGGILCSSCRAGHTFTYSAAKCINKHHCGPADMVLLAFLVVLFWAVLIAILLFVLKLHLRIGSGQLYCLIYYFGVLQYLTVNEFPSFFLKVVVSICSAFLELNPTFLGLIDRCFKPEINHLGHLILRYMHPLFLALVVVMIIAVTRFWPRFSTISKQNYSVRALCILLYLSFTSLSETSLQILSFIQFEGVSGVYVKVEPTIRYFDPGRHMPFALIAIFVEIFFVLPFLFLILFAPWLARIPRLNLTRIKPVIDEYQGCYRDSCRWFAGYYLLWRQLVFIFSLVDLGEFGGIFFLQHISIVVLAIHAAFRPYKRQWLNILDIILLSDLAIYSLFNGSTANVVLGNARAFRDAIVHILILIPLLYFLALCCFKLIMLIRTNQNRRTLSISLSSTVHRNKYENLDNSTSSHTYQPPIAHPEIREREPLIFDSVEPDLHTSTKTPNESGSSGLESESERSSVTTPMELERETERHVPWYGRLSRGLQTLRRAQPGPERELATPNELMSSTGSVARDVRTWSTYTTSVVTTSLEGSPP